jgi:hypothetical protein
MVNEVSVANHTSLLDHYDRAFTIIEGRPLYPATESGSLIPRQDIAPLVTALEVIIRPATPKQMAEVLATLAVSWPFAHQKPNADVMEAYAHQLRKDIAHFPADILMDVVAELRRASRFMPSISEIHRPASDALYARKAKLDLVLAHRKEHARRDHVAAKQAEEERLRVAKEQDRLDRLVVAYGDRAKGFTVDDLRMAGEGMFWINTTYLSAWFTALDAGDQWALDAFAPAVECGKEMAASGDDRRVRFNSPSKLRAIIDALGFDYEMETKNQIRLAGERWKSNDRADMAAESKRSINPSGRVSLPMTGGF